MFLKSNPIRKRMIITLSFLINLNKFKLDLYLLNIKPLYYIYQYKSRIEYLRDYVLLKALSRVIVNCYLYLYLKIPKSDTSLTTHDKDRDIK